ncbi:MAG: 4Fe-4S dicluster domain-containing protein, partial [Bacteroidota bacterium]
ELLAAAVLLTCVVFLIRRNVLKIKRFWSREMTAWPRSDANYILIFEIVLMMAFFTMNAADPYVDGFIVSGWFKGLLPADADTLHYIERVSWWFHIIGILCFLNYLPYSKHFHILLAFPNVYYSNLDDKGRFDNMEAVKKEVEIMFDPNADPYAPPPEPDPDAPPVKFGAKDVRDLTWKQLMDAYSCTECGRCTSDCPANQTGKLLSPRKIMMDTRDRLEEVGRNVDEHGPDHDDGKALLKDYITPEELWACTSCNACTQACPVNIDPLSIIIDLRRHLVMEESAAPSELNGMFTNIENNGAPWQFSQADRLNWAHED